MYEDIREQLRSVEDQLREKRKELARAKKVAEAAKAALAEHDGEGTVVAAEGALEAVRTVQGEIDELREEQLRGLRTIGDIEKGMPGFTSPGVNGWEQAAREIDLGAGKLHVDLAGASLMRPMAQLPGGGAGGGGGTAASVSVRTPQDRAANRALLYPWALPQSPFPAGSPFVTSDYTISFSDPGMTGLTGVERDVDATTAKESLDATVATAAPAAREFAVVLEGVPQRIFDTEGGLRALLESECRRALDQQLDAHVISAIDSASPVAGSPTGTGLIAKVRNAVAEHRALGSSPSVLAISPASAAALDLTTTDDSMARDYIFVVRASDGSPLWSLTVVESQAVPDTDAYVLDPARLGVLLVGAGSIVADPLTGLTTNVVRLRVEVEARAHIRSAIAAYTFTI